MYTFVLSESKRRVKPSADVRVVIPSKKNTTQTTPVTQLPQVYKIKHLAMQSAFTNSVFLKSLVNSSMALWLDATFAISKFVKFHPC